MPKVKYHGITHSDYYATQHHFTVEHPNLGKNRANVFVNHYESSNKGYVDIHNEKDEDNPFQKMGSLSHAHQRHVIGRIKHHIPKLNTLFGSRTTGARKESHKEGSADISRIKPIGE
jgi:hypothetical protein